MSEGQSLDAAMKRLWRFTTRLWVLALVGVLATAALALSVYRAPGVYYGSADVVLILPSSQRIPNALGLYPASLIATAGVLQREVTGGPDEAHVVSGDVTIVDEGDVRGVSVTLPNVGGQWANNFEKASLHVQAADPDPAVAFQKLRGTVSAIQDALAARQDAVGVVPGRRIRAEVSPTQLAVSLLTGDRKRATVATALLGLSLTLSLMVRVDQRRRPGAQSGRGHALDRLSSRRRRSLSPI